MITTLLSVAAFALLFAVLAVVRPRAGCGGNCASCTGGSCSLSKPGDDHG